MKFILLFEKSLVSEDVPLPNMFVTSEENAYGILFVKWFNGEALHLDAKYPKNYYDLKLIKTKYLKQATHPCTKDTSNRCIIEMIVKNLEHGFEYHNKCSRPCQPISFPVADFESLKLFPKCETMKDYVCNLWIAYYTEKNASKICPKHCSKYEYRGKRYHKVGTKNNNYNITWFYRFLSKNFEVHEEYLLYDTTGLIGSVGGTLGLFTGFSFLEVINNIIDFTYKRLSMVISIF